MLRLIKVAGAMHIAVTKCILPRQLIMIAAPGPASGLMIVIAWEVTGGMLSAKDKKAHKFIYLLLAKLGGRPTQRLERTADAAAQPRTR
jgi:hypothetical protein